MLPVTTSMAVISANVIKDLAEMERIAVVFTYIFSDCSILHYKLLQHHEDCIYGIHLDACHVGFFNHNLFNDSLPVYYKWAE